MSFIHEQTPPKANARRPHPRMKFTPIEDNLLIKLIHENGTNNWENIARLMPNRNARQCRERWINYLSPNISNEPWTQAEDVLLEQKFYEFGAKWVKISKFFKNRTDTMLKNRWLVLRRRAKKLLTKTQQAQAPVQPEAPKEPPQPKQPPPPPEKPSIKLPSLHEILPKNFPLPIPPKLSFKKQCMN